MLTEGGKLGSVGGAVLRAAIQGIEPHRHPSIAGGQGEELQLLDPFPLGIVAWLQMRHSFLLWLVREEAGKSHGHAVGVEAAQIEPVAPGRIGYQFAPDESPMVVDGVQHPASPVIVQLLRPFDLGIEFGDGVAGGPIHQVVQSPGVAEPGLGDQFGHQAVIQISLLCDGAVPSSVATLEW